MQQVLLVDSMADDKEMLDSNAHQKEWQPRVKRRVAEAREAEQAETRSEGQHNCYDSSKSYHTAAVNRRE